MKRLLILIAAMFLLVGALNVLADQVGCCTNPGAGALSCSTDRLALRDSECCPTPENSFPGYYSTNASGPRSYNECSSNFFFPNQACSVVQQCNIGCCCTPLGGQVKPKAQCTGPSSVFHEGRTDCSQLCTTPQCNDGIDNDNNGCADAEGGDLGCISAADATEAGGNCASQSASCNDPNYSPKLGSFVIAPVKGQKVFSLRWQDQCSETAAFYDISRCKGPSCSNFAVVGVTSTNSFSDASEDLLFNNAYTYQIKAHYNLQSATPTITGSGNLGNAECFGKTNEIFCMNNSAYICSNANILTPEGTQCPSTKVCIVKNNQATCVDKVSCNYEAANPFGLFYVADACENNRYCFNDRSSSIADACFACSSAMSCYDYKSQGSCARDNCNVGSCLWKPTIPELGLGVCISTVQSNCKWCNAKGTSGLGTAESFNEVYDFCTQQKSNALSQAAFGCFYRNGTSLDCKDVVCRDYDASQCGSSPIAHDENNRITSPSNDACGIKFCQNMNGVCVKNMDGDNAPDCQNVQCEKDYFSPNATMRAITRAGKLENLLIDIYDKTSPNSLQILKTSQNYTTYLCVEPCGATGHPYDTSTVSRNIIVSGLNAFDGATGNKLLVLREGQNVIRYYAQDPSKNIGEVKKLTAEATIQASGPRVFSMNVSGSSKVNEKFFTKNLKPAISVQFFEPAIVTFARLVNDRSGVIIQLQGSNTPNVNVNIPVTENLQNGEYRFEMNAKSNSNIFMNPVFASFIVVDNIAPSLNITPANGSLINASLVNLKLSFSEEVNLQSVKLNNVDVASSFSTADRKMFQVQLNVSDGDKKIDVNAADYANNAVNKTSEFVVDALPTLIVLVKPKYGVSSSYSFNLTVETDNNAVCRHNIDDNFDFEFMDPFTTTGGTEHSIMNFNGIASGDNATHKLYVRCRAARGESLKSFDISVDTSQPVLKSFFAHPDPVIESPSNTTLTIEADEPVICKYSKTANAFNDMQGLFDEFPGESFNKINRHVVTAENEGNHSYFVACMNRADLVSGTRQISFYVNLSMPMTVTSHTPDLFNSTEVTLAVETNKKAQCKYSETDSTVNTGDIFGVPSISHTKKLTLPAGGHTFYVKCRDQFLQAFSGVLTINFIIDTTAPSMLFVNDTSTLKDYAEKTCSMDKLRARWLGKDDESGIKEYFYSVIRKSDNRLLVNSTKSIVKDEWVWIDNLSLENNMQYYFSVKSKNYVNLLSAAKDSDGILVDTSLCTGPNSTVNLTCADRGDCAINQTCSDNSDCLSRFCNSSKCAQPSCSDSIKNQNEADIDCGSVCSQKCQNDKSCNTDADCQSNFCSAGKCKVQESCSDGKFSPGEADVDCGGHCPVKCALGKSCDVSTDCGAGLQCISSSCKIPPSGNNSGTGNDSDGDGLPDDWELQNGLNPDDPNDADLDSDNDGLTNYEEYQVHITYETSTDPNSADTDNDGFEDKDEIDSGTNPVNSEDFPKSSFGKILMFILGILVLISGAGYLGYRVVMKRREEEFPSGRSSSSSGSLSRPFQATARAQAPSAPIQQQAKPGMPQQKSDSLKIKEELRKKEDFKKKERERLFTAFGDEKEKPKELKETKEIGETLTKGKEEPARKIRKQQARQKKSRKKAKKSKEDVFNRLREIAKESKQGRR